MTQGDTFLLHYHHSELDLGSSLITRVHKASDGIHHTNEEMQELILS